MPRLGRIELAHAYLFAIAGAMVAEGAVRIAVEVGRAWMLHHAHR